jgi:hypothetical protein
MGKLFVGWALFCIIVWFAILYVAIHFIAKFW